MVHTLAQLLNIGEVDQLGHDLSAEISRGVQAGADSGATNRQLTQAGQSSLDALNTSLDLAGVASELLTQGDRNSIHQVGAAGLNDVLPLLSLVFQGGLENL